MQIPRLFVVNILRWKKVAMADNTVRYFKIARILALGHMLIGILFFIVGVIDRSYDEFWTGNMGFGMWCGAWIVITGILGVPGSSRENTSSRRSYAAVYMGFTITSAVLGGLNIISCSIAIASYRALFYTQFAFKTIIAIKAIMLVLGITEFAIGILAAILGCVIGTCCCGVLSNQPTSGMYMTTQGVSAGYVSLAQGPDGGPVDMPVPEAGGVGTFPDGQPQGVPKVHLAGQPQAYQMVPGHMQATQTVMTSAPEMQRQMDHEAEGGQVPPPCIGEDQILVKI